MFSKLHKKTSLFIIIIVVLIYISDEEWVEQALRGSGDKCH